MVVGGTLTTSLVTMKGFVRTKDGNHHFDATGQNGSLVYDSI